MRTHVDSDHGKRSGWTIEPAGVDSDNHVVQDGNELLMRRIHGIYHNGRWQHACKKCMQTAARIGMMFCALASVRMRNGASTSICVIVMHRCDSNAATRLGGSNRRRHDPGELRNHEKGCQHTDKATYRPQPLHRCFVRPYPSRSAPESGVIARDRQSARLAERQPLAAPNGHVRVAV